MMEAEAEAEAQGINGMVRSGDSFVCTCEEEIVAGTGRSAASFCCFKFSCFDLNPWNIFFPFSQSTLNVYRTKLN